MQQRYLLIAVLFSLFGWEHVWGIDTQGDSQGSFMLRGIGAKTCPEFLQNLAMGGRGDTTRGDYITWLSGFFSGINYAGSDTYDIGGLRNEAITEGLNWIRDYCQRNPQRGFGHGAVALIGPNQTLKP